MTSTDRERGRSRTRSVARRPRGALALFMLASAAAGLPLATWVLHDLVVHGLRVQVGWVVVLVAFLVVGELMPIQVSRQGRTSDEVTISTTFALALLFIAPIGVVVLAQSLPLVLDDVRRRKHWSRPLFNIAQYTLSFSAARAVYAALADQPFLEPDVFARQDLLPAFAAGAVFFAINHGSVGTAVALWSRERLLPHLAEDIRFQASTGGLLVCLAPLVLVAIDFSLLLVPVLLLPIAAVRHSAQMATDRERDALHDVLTGLPNRTLLHLEVTRALAEARRSGAGVAVTMVDLDRFKEINDTLGHHVGDQLIIDIARRLKCAAGDDVVVARLGGDEFALLSAADAGEQAREVAVALVERLGVALQEPVTLAGVRLDVHASMGIALFPDHGSDLEELMARADVAMYSAKETRGTWAEYDPDRDEHSPERLSLLGDLRDGIGRGELELHYQPKVESRSGTVVGAEALVRWRHPTRGLLFPDAFVPVAENTGLINTLTLVVLDTAIAQVRAWMDKGLHIAVAVNLSVRHLADMELPGQVAETLRRHGVPAHLLTLEVTESTIMSDPSRAVDVLGGVRRLGVKIAVDDYGTGYSSLAYLKRLAIDELKIDKSFVMHMRDDDNDAVIVRSTIDLGHNLGLQIVAEGVEDLETWQMLLPLGCDVVQGYCLSRPLPVERFEAWVADWQDGRELARPGAPTVPDRLPVQARRTEA